MRATAKAAAKLGVKVVNGFTGSSIWGMWYFFPPTGPEHVKAGFDDFAKRWGPILDVFKAEGVKFALEVHPGEFAHLFNVILINVTSFFRDEASWDYLRDTALPEMLAERTAFSSIRASARCCRLRFGGRRGSTRRMSGQRKFQPAKT